MLHFRPTHLTAGMILKDNPDWETSLELMRCYSIELMIDFHSFFQKLLLLMFQDIIRECWVHALNINLDTRTSKFIVVYWCNLGLRWMVSSDWKFSSLCCFAYSLMAKLPLFKKIFLIIKWNEFSNVENKVVCWIQSLKYIFTFLE